MARLDGLRGIAVAAVVLYHLGWARSGFLGVDVFFVLSGFLITGLLLGELKISRTISLPRFTRRRLLRLYPALVVVVAFVVLLSVATGDDVGGSLRDAAAALTYTGNLVALHGLLDHVWTLALEEQFYLLWPALLLLCVGRRWGYWPAVALVGLLLAAALVHGQSGALHTYVRAMGLPVGCALALAKAPSGRLARLGPAALCALLVAFFVPLPSWLTTGWPMSLAVPLTAAAVAWLAVGEGGLLAARVPVWLGRRSYSLYLWHFPLISLTLHHAPAAVPEWSRKLLAVVVSLVLADLSFRCVEMPVLRWRDRHVPTSGESAAGLAPLGADG